VIQTLSVVRVIPASAAPVRALALTPNQTHVLTAGDDKTVKMWNVANGANERSFAGPEGAVNAVALSKNNTLVAVAGGGKTVRVYHRADGKQVGAFPVPAPVRAPAVSPNSLTLAAGCEDKSVATWNVPFNPGQPPPAGFGNPSQTFAHAAGVTDLAF